MKYLEIHSDEPKTEITEMGGGRSTGSTESSVVRLEDIEEIIDRAEKCAASNDGEVKELASLVFDLARQLEVLEYALRRGKVYFRPSDS